MNVRTVKFVLVVMLLGVVACDDSGGTTNGDESRSDADAPGIDTSFPEFDVSPGDESSPDGDVSPLDDLANNNDASSVDEDLEYDGCEGQVASDLCFLREEEKLARDVYIVLYEETGIRVFDNISRSEQSHTDAVRDMLLARDIPDPVTDDTVGVFVDPTLAALYTDLTTAGRASDVSALTVGATIEDLDIHDIDVMMSHASETDVLALYESLQCGSRNHMRAFTSQLQSRGESYVAQYISAEDLEAILASPSESCTGR